MKFYGITLFYIYVYIFLIVKTIILSVTELSDIFSLVTVMFAIRKLTRSLIFSAVAFVFVFLAIIG